MAIIIWIMVIISMDHDGYYIIYGYTYRPWQLKHYFTKMNAKKATGINRVCSKCLHHLSGLIQYGKAFMKRVDLSQQGGNS